MKPARAGFLLRERKPAPPRSFGAANAVTAECDAAFPNGTAGAIDRSPQRCRRNDLELRCVNMWPIRQE